jgi:hypothetical protein
MTPSLLLALMLGPVGAGDAAVTRPDPASPAALLERATAAPAPPGLEPQPVPIEPSGAPAAGQPPEDRRDGWRHAIGVGAHAITFYSKQGSQFSFRSGCLGYLGSVGETGAFLHAFFLWPLQARQDGDVFPTGSYYRARQGADLLLGAEHRWTLQPGLELEAGPGLHGTFVYLPGKQGYRDFSAFPLGLGAGGVLRWATRGEGLRRTVTVDTFASVAYDFRDPLHANDLSHGFAVRVGVSVGLGAPR